VCPTFYFFASFSIKETIAFFKLPSRAAAICLSDWTCPVQKSSGHGRIEMKPSTHHQPIKTACLRCPGA